MSAGLMIAAIVATNKVGRVIGAPGRFRGG